MLVGEVQGYPSLSFPLYGKIDELRLWNKAFSQVEINAKKQLIILYTTNGGDNWISIENVTNIDSGGIDFIDKNNGIIIGSNGTILIILHLKTF